MQKVIKKISKISAITVIIIAIIIVTSYLFIIPKIVSSPRFANTLSKITKENLGADLIIDAPVLETSIKPYINFKVTQLSLTKNTELILSLKNIDSKIDFSNIFARKIKLEKLGADEIYIDVNKLKKLTFKEKEEKKETKSFFTVDCFNTLFYIKKCTILYNAKNNVNIKLLAKDLGISASRDPKIVHFNILLDVRHNKNHLVLQLNEQDNIYFKNRKLHIDNFQFKVNDSLIAINGLLDDKNNYDITFQSDKFDIYDVNTFLETNLVVANGSDIVSSFKDFSGNFKFKTNINNDGINGFVKINKIGAKLIPVADVPLTLTNGAVIFEGNNIILQGFKGYYANNPQNILSMEGIVKDYTKTAATELLVKGIVNNTFAQYISKISGVNIAVKNTTPIETEVIAANNKLSIKGNIDIPVGSDILFNNASVSSLEYERIFDYDLDIKDNNLSINHIGYNIKDKSVLQELLNVALNINLANGTMNMLEFDVPKPLPSEFFNVFIGQNLFRNGTFSGKMKLENSHLNGEMALKDVFIVGQVTIIKNMIVKASGNNINIASDGGIRLSFYKFHANIVNNLVYPIIVTDADFSLDDMNLEKLMKTFAPRPQRTPQKDVNNGTVVKRQMPELAKSDISKDYFKVEQKIQTTQKASETSEPISFQPNLIEIKKCMLNIKKGTYKELNFGNLQANLTLDRNGILEVKSNKFDFAEGISTLKVFCDLAKTKYNVILGGKNVNTDIISTSILNLPREISGKANTFIELNTDENMKLNGKIRFEVKDGSIAKLGLVQYILNLATIFRNPIVMIGPTSLFDLVNIPDGEFKNIKGTLDIKNNIIEKLVIKSSSPNLSSLIMGRINLETMDVSLNIFTKFSDNHSGFLGALRGMSLDTISKKATKNYKKNDISYYAAVLELMPKLDECEDIAHIYLTQINGDIQTSNYISTVKKIK